MPYIDGQQQETGDFVPTTQIYEIQEGDVTQLLVRLYQTVNNMAVVINRKVTGLNLLEEFVTGSLFFNPTSTNPLDLRPGYHKVFDIEPLGAGVTTIAHGITIDAAWKLIRITGGASDNVGFNYYPLPFTSAAGATNIEVKLNATNLVITNNSGVAFTSAIVIVEYLKQ